MSLLRIYVKFNHKIKFKLFFLIKLKSQIFSLNFEIMMIFFFKNTSRHKSLTHIRQ